MLTSVGRLPALAVVARPMRFELAEEVVDGLLGRHALIVEADLIAHGVIAKDDLQRLPLLLDAPRSIEHLGIAQKALAIARDPAVGRAGENLLVGGDPFDAGRGDRRDDRLADRTFRRPHAARLLAEQFACGIRRPGESARRRLRDSLRDASARLTSGIACRASRLSHSSGRIG